jgi:hypothetical protein
MAFHFVYLREEGGKLLGYITPPKIPPRRGDPGPVPGGAATQIHTGCFLISHCRYS